MHSPGEKKPILYDHIYSFESEKDQESFRTFISKMADLIDQSCMKKNLSIFEPGAGTGLISLPLLLELANRKYIINYLGIDLNSEMVKKFESKKKDYKSLKSSIEIETIDFWNWTKSKVNKERKFNLILDFWFLHHLENKWKCGLTELDRFLIPGGLLLVAEDLSDLSFWIYGNLNNLRINGDHWDRIPTDRKAFINCAYQVIGHLRKKGHMHYREISAGYREPMIRILSSYLKYDEMKDKSGKPVTVFEAFENKNITKCQWKDIINAETFSFINHIEEKEKGVIKEELYRIICGECKECQYGKKCQNGFVVKREFRVRALRKRKDVDDEKVEKLLIDESFNFDSADLMSETDKFNIAKIVQEKNYEKVFYRSILVDRLKKLLDFGLIRNALFITLISYDVNKSKEGAFRDHIPVFFNNDDKEKGQILLKTYVCHLAAMLTLMPKLDEDDFRGVNYIFRDFPLKGEFRIVIKEIVENRTEIKFENLTKDLEYIEMRLKPEECLIAKESIETLELIINNVEKKFNRIKNEYYENGLIVNSDDIFNIAREIKDSIKPTIPLSCSPIINDIKIDLNKFIKFYKDIDKQYGNGSEINFDKASKGLNHFIKLMIGNINLFNFFYKKLNGGIANICSEYSYFSYKTHEEERDLEGVRGRQQVSTGGLMIGQCEDTEIDRKLLKVLLKLPFRTDAIHDWAEKAVKDMKKHALRSAVAAIMSRNMSHNIGSHVIASLSSSKIADYPEDTFLLTSYLQERMDFVARAATEWPEWAEPIFFFSDLLQRFFNQGLLLDSIVRDDGIDADHIRFRVKNREEHPFLTFSIKRRKQEDKRDFTRFELDENQKLEDFLVSIPGGTVGKQAFYGFLENAIRNAAKHNDRQKDQRLEISIKVDEALDDELFYNVTYFDNISYNRNQELGKNVSKKSLVDKISDIIQTPLIDKFGEMKKEKWGIQEMKVYADFLSYPFLYSSRGNDVYTNDGKVRCRLCAEPINYFDNTTVGNYEILSYKFCLQKARIILFVDSADGLDDSQHKTARQIGIYFKKYEKNKERELLKEIQSLSPQLLVFVQNQNLSFKKIKKFIQKNDPFLPFRILILFRDENQKNSSEKETCTDDIPLYKSRFFCSIHNEYPSNNDKKNWEQFLVRVYNQWVLGFTESSINTKFNIFVNFERDKDFSGFERWMALSSELKNFGLVNVKIHLYQTLAGNCSLFSTKADEEADWKNSRNIIFDNHKKMDSKLNKDIRNSEPFSQVIGHDHSLNLNNHSIFDLFQNAPNGLSGALFILQIIETSHMKILFIDERIASHVAKIQREEILLDLDRAEYLNKAGVFFTLLFRNNEGSLSLLKGGDRNIGISLDENNIEGVRMEDNEAKEIGIFWSPYFNKQRCFDAIVIHWGWLEHLRDKYKTDLGKMIESLKMFSQRVIVTSGRGMTKEIPRNLPFIEFSAIQNYIMGEFSKYHIGKIVFSIMSKKEETRDERNTSNYYPNEQ